MPPWSGRWRAPDSLGLCFRLRCQTSLHRCPALALSYNVWDKKGPLKSVFELRKSFLVMFIGSLSPSLALTPTVPALRRIVRVKTALNAFYWFLELPMFPPVMLQGNVSQSVKTAGPNLVSTPHCVLRSTVRITMSSPWNAIWPIWSH